MTATTDEWAGQFDADEVEDCQPPESILQHVIDEHPELEPPAAFDMAREVVQSLRSESKRRLVRRIADDTDAAKAMNLASAQAINAGAFLAETSDRPAPASANCSPKATTASWLPPSRPASRPPSRTSPRPSSPPRRSSERSRSLGATGSRS